MEGKPLVSVYITTKNRAQLLKRAIDSVLEQTWPNFELLIANDGSTDETDNLVQQYLTRHDNIKYIQNPVSLGACVSRNKAIELAEGKFITGLDDDDYFLPSRIEQLVDAFEPGYSFVCSTFYRKENGQQNLIKDCVGEVSLADVLHYNRIGNQILTLTERLKHLGGFDANFPAFQDYDMWVRLMSEYGNALKVPTASYVCDVSLDAGRISRDKPKVLAGYNQFVAKHQNIMSQQHLNSMKLLKYSIIGTRPPLLDILKFANRGNIKSVLNQLIKSKV